MRILIVEDEKNIANSLKQGLEEAGYKAIVSSSGEDAFFLINDRSFDLIVLDWMLPGRSGIDIIGALRKQGHETPVLMLTAKDAIEDKVKGLDAGADDYLVKPFDFVELLARIRCLLRRRQQQKGHIEIQIEDLKINKVNRTASRELNGREEQLELTVKEFDILYYLCLNAGTTVSREMITKEVWKITSRATPMDSVIDVHMARLRKKVDEPFEAKLIQTVRGIGHRILK